VNRFEEQSIRGKGSIIFSVGKKTIIYDKVQGTAILKYNY